MEDAALTRVCCNATSTSRPLPHTHTHTHTHNTMDASANSGATASKIPRIQHRDGGQEEGDTPPSVPHQRRLLVQLSCSAKPPPAGGRQCSRSPFTQPDWNLSWRWVPHCHTPTAVVDSLFVYSPKCVCIRVCLFTCAYPRLYVHLCVYVCAFLCICPLLNVPPVICDL